MNILILTKRQYMNKDLLDDLYGRFRELPLELSKQGHSVVGLALSYKNKSEGVTTDKHTDGQKFVVWHSVNAGLIKPLGLLRFIVKAENIIKDFNPDIIYACSDTLYSIAGVHLKKKMKSKCFVDLYDNFESYASANIPFVLPLFKKSLTEADGITTNSTALMSKVVDDYGVSAPVRVIENAIPGELFIKMDKTACRAKYQIPADAEVIGTCGALSHQRGIGVLINSFLKLYEENNNLHLALAGKMDRNVKLPQNSNIHYCGELSYKDIPQFMNTCDVGVVCNINSKFGRYCFPQKIHEFLSCHVALVAADIGPTHDLLKSYPHCLYEVGNKNDCSAKISNQLKKPSLPDITIPTWHEMAGHLDELFKHI